MKTINLSRRRFLHRVPPAFLISLAIFGGAGVASAVRHFTETTSAKPIILIQTATAQPVATSAGITVADARPVRYVNCWASPNGDLLGPIPAPDASAITARWGNEFLQTTWQGSPVWVKTSDMLGIPNTIADVQPAPTAAPAIVVAQVVEPTEQPYQVDAAPTPVNMQPAPNPRTAAVLDRQQWAMMAATAAATAP